MPPSSTIAIGSSDEVESSTSNAVSDDNRFGLATKWGETRNSPISTVQFTRSNPASPTATATLYYNDRQGAEAMSSIAGYQRLSEPFFLVEGGLVSLGIKDQSGNLLEGFIANGKRYVIGEMGRRYSIVVRNNTANRLEAVLSVDGLDVLDGKPAAFTKRGYIIDSNATLTVDGFRQSSQTVAAFRFSSVTDSYTNQKYGNTNNVGVIGLAIFHESGSYPIEQEIQQRHSADPFPNRFATPP